MSDLPKHQQIAAGLDPEDLRVEYRCHRCQTVTMLDGRGGSFDCDCTVPPNQIHVTYVLPDESRHPLGSFADVMGYPPDTQWKLRKHSPSGLTTWMPDRDMDT